MALIDQELHGAWWLEQDEKGVKGVIKYRVAEADMFSADLPVPGDPWPAHDLPWLICKRGHWDEEESGMVVCTYTFSTDRSLDDEWYEVSFDFGVEEVDITKGWTWLTAGTVIEDTISTTIPVIHYTLIMKKEAIPATAIQAAIGRINLYGFHGFAAGGLRFDGAQTDCSYNRTGGVTGVRSVYKFTSSARSHNYVWRQPLADVDVNGNEMRYQNQDAAADNYTTDNALIGTLVYVSGAAGTAGWDTPTNAGFYRYEAVDFTEILDIPDMAGDL